MSFPLNPVSHSSSPHSNAPVFTEETTENGIQKIVADRLPQAMESSQSSQPSTWQKFASWLNPWGKKESNMPLNSEAATEYALDKEEDEVSENDGDAQANLGLEETEESVPLAANNQVEANAAKVEQVTQVTYLQKALKWAGTRYLESCGNFDKDRVLREQEQDMSAQFSDRSQGTQFVEFYKIIDSCASFFLEKEYDKTLNMYISSDNPLLAIATSQKSSIFNLIQVVIARGFANLAHRLKSNPGNGVGTETPLASIFSFLYRCIEETGLSPDKVKEIEHHYQQRGIDVLRDFPSLFPEANEDICLALKNYIQTTDPKKKEGIQQSLSLQCVDQTEEALKSFFDRLDAISLKRHQKFCKRFTQVADTILLSLLPDKFNGIPEITGRVMKFTRVMRIAEKWIYPLMRDGLAGALQENYDKFIPPMLDVEQKRSQLEKKLETPYWGNLFQALPKILPLLAPNMVKSYRSVGDKIFQTLADRLPALEESNQFAAAIAQLAQAKDVKDRLLLAYKTITNSAEELETLKKKLEECSAKATIQGIYQTPEAIAAMIGDQVPNLGDQQQPLAKEIERFIQGNSLAYQSMFGIIGASLEGELLNLFLQIAEKYPAENGQDSLTLFAEKLKTLLSEKYQRAKQGNIQDVESELKDIIVQMRIDLTVFFKMIPNSTKIEIYEMAKERLTHFFQKAQASQAAVVSDLQVEQAQERAKAFGMDERSETYLQKAIKGFINDAIMGEASIFRLLTQITQHEMQGVIAISNNVEGYLQKLANDGFDVARVLLDYPQKESLPSMIKYYLEELAKDNFLGEEKQYIADLLSKLFLIPLSQVLETTAQIEKAHPNGEMTRGLMAKLFQISAAHLRHLNAAQELAQEEYKKEHRNSPAIRHEDFLAAASQSGELHPAVPRIITSAEDLQSQRDQHFYKSTIKAITKAYFPQGKANLTFVPEEFRGLVWKILNKQLLPQVLPLIVKTLLDPKMIRSVVVSAFENMRDSLNGDIVLNDSEEIVPSPADESLLKGLTELVSASLDTLELPAWIKNKLVDSTGQLNPAMKESLKLTLLKTLNGTFIQESIQKALKAAAQPKGGERELPDLKAISREAIDATISYLIRSKWALAQKRFDRLVERVCGKVGKEVKQALDRVFHYLFFDIIGRVLLLLLKPIKIGIREAICRVIAVDKNLDTVMSRLTRLPEDQPKVDGNEHVIYNENLMYRIVESIYPLIVNYAKKIKQPTQEVLDPS